MKINDKFFTLDVDTFFLQSTHLEWRTSKRNTSFFIILLWGHDRLTDFMVSSSEINDFMPLPTVSIIWSIREFMRAIKSILHFCVIWPLQSSSLKYLTFSEVLKLISENILITTTCHMSTKIFSCLLLVKHQLLCKIAKIRYNHQTKGLHDNSIFATAVKSTATPPV